MTARFSTTLPLFVLAGLAGTLFTAAVPQGCQDDPTCAERVDASVDYVNSVLRQHLACRQVSDCTTVSVSTQCQGACPVAVNVDGVDDVQAAVEYANANWCEGYIEDGCPYATPSCALGELACVENQCVIDYSVEPARAPAR